METIKTKDIPVQGAEVVTAKKKQKASESYTLTSNACNIQKLSEMELITKEDEKTLWEIQKRAAEKFMAKKFGQVG